tara:strand:- start:538 stop:1431 length:894 start_codon:yes stop_codon:yes gene_type:complete
MILPDYENSVMVKDLSFKYSNVSPLDKRDNQTIINNVSFELKKGSRCLLMGANGSGKSTLMRILSGRHLTKNPQNIRVCGLDPYGDCRMNFHRSYLDCNWGLRSVSFTGSGIPMCADIPVSGMMEKLQSEYPERRDEIVKMLRIDLNWRMNCLSDGQRRRVQLLLGLVRPFEILLMDEITTSLDVIVRQDLLRWLEKESKTRGCTIIYATHIFDGLDDWPTDLLYLKNDGTIGYSGKLTDLDYYVNLKKTNHPAKMLAVAEYWLRAEVDKLETEAGVVDLCDPRDRQGGYASGRGIK